MKVFWIIINFFVFYTNGLNSDDHDCVLTPPHDWKGMYDGQRSTTVTGKTCKMWKVSNHPPYGTENYCRAPREDPASAIGPWCYIDVYPYWEYCFIPTCDEHCVKSATDKHYKGTLNVTISGLSCRMWNLNTLLPAGGNPPLFQDEIANYCRSPSGDVETKPWCYTDSPDKRWEHCAVPLCNDIQATICPDLIGSDLFTEPTILTGYTYNTVVTFKCKAGYMIQGSSSLKCLVNSQASIYGRWNTTQPTCVPIQGINCQALRINHSNIQMTDNAQPHTALQVICDPGYQIQGDANIQCDNNSRWNSIPSCICVPCPLTSVAHSDVQSVNNKRFPDTITVTCDHGYNINGINTLQCLDTGRWSTAPSCIGVQCPPISITNSNVQNMGIKRFPEYIQVTCDSGYLINGSSDIHCTATGQWDTISTCVGIQCPSVSITNSNVQNIDHKQYPEYINVTCNSGYRINGSSTINCTETGQWSTLPTCVGVQCPSVYIDNSNVQSMDRYRYPDSIQIKCNNGYQINGSSNVRCTETGRWDTLPTCVGIACPDLVLRAHLSIPTRLSNYTYNNTVRFVCDTGYYVVGNEIIVCSTHGHWNGSVPTCEPVPCPGLNIANATKQTVDRRYYYRDRVNVTCNKGFALKGKANLVCLENGEWGATLPVCQKIACNVTSVLPNVLAAQSETMVDVNDNVTFFCRPGFSGLTVISTCSFDMTWIPKPPICTSKSVLSIGLSYTVFGLVDAGIITCSIVVISGVVIYFRRRLKATESHYESIQMGRDFKSRENTDEVYSELT